MKPQVTSTFLALSLLACPIPAEESAAAAAAPIQGLWKWTFTMPDGSQVHPRLEIKNQNGQLSGITRLRTGTEAAITNLAINGSEVSFEVVRERDGRAVL